MSAGNERNKPTAPRPTAPTDALGPGDLVKDTYRILEFVGEGGAGAVFVAEHVNLGHQVAIKTLFSKFVRDDDMRRRFVEEAIIQANLAHPNIVKVIDVVDARPVSAIIMEYVDGSSLDKHLTKRSAPAPIGETLDMFVAILDAMSTAHAEGVVHRDIKPANIMLASAGDGWVPKVTDFGIAKVVSAHQRTETGTAMGTVYYASPEQLTDAKSVDHRADVYSLGCTLYEMLTLKLPFEDDTMFGVMRKHLQAPRPDPARLNEAVPRPLALAVMRAMAVKPEHRFQTCAEFRAEVKRVTGEFTAPPAPGMANTPTGTPGHGPVTGVGINDPLLSSQLGGPHTPTGAGASAARSTARRSAARSIRAGTITAPPRPTNDRNIVGMLIWGLIGVLAIGILIAVLTSGDDEPDKPPAVAPPVAAPTPAPPSAPPAEPAPSPGEPADGPAEDAALDVATCTALSTRYIDFDPFGRTTIEEAIAELEENTDPCARVLEASAGSPFETLNVELTTMQTRAVQRQLEAANASDSEACGAALSSVTEVHRALRHLDAEANRMVLLAYEEATLRAVQDTFTSIYVDLLETYDCPFALIPDALLGPEGLRPIRRAGAAPEGSAQGARAPQREQQPPTPEPALGVPSAAIGVPEPAPEPDPALGAAEPGE